MTTPPKARRYNTQAMASITPQTPPPAEPTASDSPAPPRLEVARRSDAPASDASERQARLERFLATEPIDDGLGDFRLTKPAAPSPEKDTPAAPPADSGDMEARLAAIRAEKLTERQLRIAKRIAALHQIEVSSAEEAVLRLRERGIDPSHRTAVGSILSSEGTRAQAAPSPNAPAVRQAPVPSILPDRSPAPPGRPALPSREELTEKKRAAEIYRIQRDLARRRRRRMAMLAMRLALFVFLPTALVGIYYGRYASPLYATVSQFQIQSAESGSGASGLSGMLGGSGLGTNQDAVAVQSYLTSRDAMLRLGRGSGLPARLPGPVGRCDQAPARGCHERGHVQPVQGFRQDRL